MVEVKQLAQIGGNTAGFICTNCRKLTDEEEGRLGRNGLICDNCDEEPSLEGSILSFKQSSKEEPNFNENIEKVKEKTINNNNSYEFVIEDGKSNQITKEISNSKELNNQIIIPKELNIIDCPYGDKNWFRKQFKNYWRLINGDNEWVFMIHDRGTGKSNNGAITILYNIAKYNVFEGSFIMREWEAPVRQAKEYFKMVINEFTETTWQGEKKSKWNLFWSSTYKGISYKSSLAEKAGELRAHFFSLFDSDSARTLIKKPNTIAIFDECIPTRDKIKQGKGWKLDEPNKYMDLMKSLGRNAPLVHNGSVVGNKPQKVFSGNPNDSWRNCWFLTAHFNKELELLEKWYWTNRPKNFNDWLNWNWIKEYQQGNKVLQLQKIVRKKEDFPTFEDDNWDNFFQKPEDLKIVKHKNSAIPMWIFNDCVLYCQQNKNSNYFYFISKDNKEISQRDQELLKNKVECCITPEQRMRSKQRIKRDRTREELQNKLLRWYEKDLLFFADMKAKSLMEEFLAKKRTQSEF